MVPQGPFRLARHNVIMLAQKPILCVVGPTASGKTALAQVLALHFDGEVVSADSMQVYRGMDIGTGKIAKHDQVVPHHCLDIVDPGEPFSAALFQDHARRSFADIEARGKTSVLCGGTGFYIRAAIDDYDFPKGEQIGNETRDRYNRIAQEHGNDELWALLWERDPESASIIPKNDTKRIVRAFELLDSATSYAEQKKKLACIPQLYPAIFIGLAVDPALLAKRIDKRVDMMAELGLVDEVKTLLDRGFRDGITSPQAIGYKEIVAFLDGTCSLPEALDAIKLATRRYAKRQRTWFRKDKRIHWVDANTFDLDAIANDSINIVEKAI